MTPLTDIASLQPAERELLEAAGVGNPSALAAREADELRAQLEIANEALAKLPAAPARDRIAAWIDDARRLVAPPAGGHDVEAVLDGAAFEAAVAAAAEAVDLLDVHGRPLGAGRPAATGAAAAPAVKSGPEPSPLRKPSIDVSRLQTFDDLREGRHRVQPVEPRQLDRIPADSKGRVSRWKRRGLEAPNPVSLYLAMVCVLVSRILFFVVVLGTPVALALQASTGGRQLFHFLPVIAVFLVFGLAHLVIALRTKCRVCHGHLLLSRGANKNIKAHRRFPLGFAGSAALHAVLFRWFRCMYCGTPTQFGKDRNAPAARARDAGH